MTDGCCSLERGPENTEVVVVGEEDKIRDCTLYHPYLTSEMGREFLQLPG